MKTAMTTTCAAIALTGAASAFSLDFSGLALGTELDPDIVINVPGYGNVRFVEAPNTIGGAPATDLSISNEFGFNGISFEDGEQLRVLFENGPVSNVDFLFAGVGSGEIFSVALDVIPDNGDRVISFTGSPGAALVGVTFIPEPSSTLLVALTGLGFLARRRR